MIKRITNPEEFRTMVDDLDELFLTENLSLGHAFDLIHDTESIKNNFANKHLLAWDVFVWANKEAGKHDAVGIFVRDKNVKFGKDLFVEFIWLSKNPKVGFKILKTATNFAREQGFEYILISSVENTPNSESNKVFYEKLGFVKDETTFIGKL